MKLPEFNDYLSAPNLINIANDFFLNILDPRKRSPRGLNLTSFLMSGIAIFFLKCESLLSYCEGSNLASENIKNIFGILDIPSDTHFRTIVDRVETNSLKGLFKEYFFLLKEKEVLKKYYVLNDYLTVLFDGTGFFYSDSVHCEQCLERHYKNGDVTYAHQALPAVVVNPKMKEVFPIGIEFIEKQDGENKNDCERNASKRIIKQLRIDYPDQKFLVVEDSLSSNVPHILALKNEGMDFILGIKPGDHKKFYEQLSLLEQKNSIIHIQKHENINKESIIFRFRYVNSVDLNNGKNDPVYVNYLEVTEVLINKYNMVEKSTKYSWITNIFITEDNILELMKIARSRWMIENETFNTLKNQGYNFEHNFGHGNKNLTNNMAIFMFIAFFIDQIQQHCCKMFQEILLRAKKKIRLWQYLQACFLTHANTSLYEIYEKIIIFAEPRTKRTRTFLDST